MIGSVQSILSSVGSTAAVGSAKLPFAAPTASPQTGGASFGDILAEVSSGAIHSLKEAEATSISAIQGQTSLIEVVEAVKSAEQTLQTAIAIRDKVVSAYQEISRMAI